MQHRAPPTAARRPRSTRAGRRGRGRARCGPRAARCPRRCSSQSSLSSSAIRSAIALREGVVDRLDDLDLLAQPGRVAVVVGAGHSRERDTASGARSAVSTPMRPCRCHRPSGRASRRALLTRPLSSVGVLPDDLRIVALGVHLAQDRPVLRECRAAWPRSCRRRSWRSIQPHTTAPATLAPSW